MTTGRLGPVRVGFVIDALAPGAGTENQLILLLRRFDPARVSSRVCCLRGDAEGAALDLPAPVEILGVQRLSSFGGLRGQLRAISWVRRHRLDLVVTFFMDANVIGTIAGRCGGAVVVSSRRNIGRGYWHTTALLRWLRFINRFAARFVANSDAARCGAIESEGIAPEKIVVIANAIDTVRFRPAAPGEQAALRAAFGLPAEALVIGCVANFRPVKGHDLLLRALAQAAPQLPEFRLVLIGKGELRESLVALASSLGLADRILFSGAHADVSESLRMLDVGVLSSHSESLSNALMEYLATGLPVVATDVGGNAEALGGVGGRLVPPRDPERFAAALVELGRSGTLRRELGLAARQRAETAFGLTHALEQWCALFESVRDRRNR